MSKYKDILILKLDGGIPLVSVSPVGVVTPGPDINNPNTNLNLDFPFIFDDQQRLSTLISPSTLIGRYSVDTGSFQEIVIGAGLSLVGNELQSSGGGGGGSGTVTNLSVVSANGFSGSVATSTTTPAITLSTSITGMLKGASGALVAATAGTDYVSPSGLTTALSSYLTTTGNGSGLTGLTKSQVGLSNVDNTSDLSKPISTLTAASIATKQDILVSGTNIKTINSTSLLGSGNISFIPLTDGDKGDITVSSSGLTWTIDAGVISLSKMADVATGTLFYRKTAGTGAPEVQTLATLKTDLGLTGTNSGDVTLAGTANYLTITGQAITRWHIELNNANHISPSFNLPLNKITAMTANRAVVSDGSGFISASSITDTELGYLSGVTSAIQTQINTINSSLGGLTDAVVLKGSWAANAGTFPGAGVAQAGWSYIVSTAGTVDGQAFSVNDRLMAIVDNASSTTFAANWFKLDYTDQVLSVNTYTGAVVLNADDISDTSTTHKFATAAEKTKLGFISVTQAVDLDTMESDIVTNNAKVTNATHTGEVIGSTTLTVDKTAITNKGAVSVASGDLFLIADVSDSNNLKQVTGSSILSLVGVSLDGDRGDITVSASGATWTIDNDVITFAKMQNIATDKLIGRDTASTGDPEEISVGGGIEFTGSGGIQTSAFTGDVTKTAGGTATTIAANAVTLAKMATIATSSFLGRITASTGNVEVLSVANAKTLLNLTGTNSGDQTITLTGDVSATGTSSFAATIANDAVTYAKMQNVSATDKVLGRSTAGAGDVEEIPCTASGRALIAGASVGAQRTTLGLGTADSPTFTNVTVTDDPYAAGWDGNNNVPTKNAIYDKIQSMVSGSTGPAGAIMIWSTNTAPSGWVLCDGTAISRTTYAVLFGIIGTTYGVGDGSTTFNVPDLRQRFPLGKAASGTGNTLAATGGTIDHVHTGPSHTHSVPAHYHGMGTGSTLNITTSGAHTHQSATGADFAIFVGGTGPVGTAAGNNLNGTNLTSSVSHTHTAGSFAGVIGLVTGGVDGNAAMVTGSGGTGNTGTGNPPFLVVNYIIKTETTLAPDFCKVATVSGSSVINTTATSPTDMTSMSLSIVVAAGEAVELNMDISTSHSAGDYVACQIMQNGTVVSPTIKAAYNMGVAATNGIIMNISKSWIIESPATGTVTYKIQWNVVSGTGYCAYRTLTAKTIKTS